MIVAVLQLVMRHSIAPTPTPALTPHVKLIEGKVLLLTLLYAPRSTLPLSRMVPYASPPNPTLIAMINAKIRNGTQVRATPARSVYLPMKKNQIAILTIPLPIVDIG